MRHSEPRRTLTRSLAPRLAPPPSRTASPPPGLDLSLSQLCNFLRTKELAGQTPREAVEAHTQKGGEGSGGIRADRGKGGTARA